MKKALKDFEQDNTSHVAVLHGIGGNFCSGFDLNELANVENQTELTKMLDSGLMVGIFLLSKFILLNNM